MTGQQRFSPSVCRKLTIDFRQVIQPFQSSFSLIEMRRLARILPKSLWLQACASLYSMYSWCWQQAEETHKSFDAEAFPLSLQDDLCVQFPPGLSLRPRVSHQDGKRRNLVRNVGPSFNFVLNWGCDLEDSTSSPCGFVFLF